MRKTDLNKYANGQTNPQNQAALTFRAVGKAIWKLLVTAFVVAFITGIIVSVSLFSYVMSMKDSKIEYDLMDLKPITPRSFMLMAKTMTAGIRFSIKAFTAVKTAFG